MSLIKSDFEADTNLTIHRFWGEVTFVEFSNLMKDYYAGNKVTQNIILDIRESDLSGIESESFELIAQLAKGFEKHRPIGKTAIVTKRPVEFGLARMLETFIEMEDVTFSVRAFQSMARAKEWLGV